MKTFTYAHMPLRRMLAAMAIFALALMPMSQVFAVVVQDKVDICHATGSGSNPYNSLSVDKNATAGGHDNDNGGIYPADPWGDIIPSYEYQEWEVVGTHLECPNNYTASNFTCPGQCYKNSHPFDANKCVNKNTVEDYGMVTHQYPGKNWTTEGQAIWNNQCVVDPGTASITVYKDTNDASGDTVEFDFAGFDTTFGVLGDNTDTSLHGNLFAGDYTITETKEAGWLFDSISCTAGKYKVNEDSASVVLSLAPGEQASCTFSNVLEVPGCTDDEATNYNPNANVDNQSCVYPLKAPAITLNDVTVSACGAQDVNLTGNVAFLNPTSLDEVVFYLDGVVVLGDEAMDDEYGPDGLTYAWARTLTNVAPGEHTVKVVMYDDPGTRKTVRAESEEIEFEIDACPTYATVVMTKILCTDETDLPNWGAGETAPDITQTTATEWVNAEGHESCRLESGWNFEWVMDNEDTDPGDTLVGPAGEPWTTFGPTDINGQTSVQFTAKDLGRNKTVWFREVLQENYLPFTHDNTDGPEDSDTISAEFYCHNDGYHYDNLEWVGQSTDPITPENTYHCVAWNYIEEVLGCTDPEAYNYNPEATPGNPDAEECVYEAPVCEIGDNLLANGSFEDPEVKGDWGVFSTVAEWAISLSDGLELWAHGFYGDASDGEQNVELDGNSSTMITQTVATTPGATYELRFDFSPRPGYGLVDNSVDALVEGAFLMNASGDGSNLSEKDWTTHTQTFVASDDSTDIALKDVGESNSLGSLIDNAVLCLVEENQEPSSLSCDSFVSDDYDVRSGQEFTLSWNVLGADFAYIKDVTDVQFEGAAGSYVTSVSGDTTFTLVAGNDGDENTIECPLFIDRHSSGGGGSRSSDDDDGEVLGASTTRAPEGEVLGASTSVMPVGAPNTGAGGTSPVVVTLPTLFAVLGTRARVEKRVG